MPAIPLDGSTGALNQRWYKVKDDAHEAVFACVRFLESQQPYRSKANLHHLRLYCNYQAMGLTGAQYARTSPGAGDRDKLTLNLSRSLVDTMQSRIVQSKPKPTFLTIGGDQSAQRVAKMMDKLNQGMFYHAKVYEAGAEVVKDAGIFGTGASKVYADRYGKPRCERVFIDELLVDEQEGKLRTPRQMFQCRAVDRELLVENFPKYKKELAEAALMGEQSASSKRGNELADQVTLIEAWHLPSTPESDDGRHIVAASNVTLVDEAWEHDYFPFVFLRWNTRPIGFYGQGIPEQVSGLQWEVNQLLRKAQQQMRLAGPKIMVERGSNISETTLDNEIWGIIEYTGTQPSHAVFDAVEPSLLQHINDLYQKGFQDVGVSQLAAMQQKPSGLNSGKALLTYGDMEDQRFLAFGQAYEQYNMEIGDRMMDIARDTHMKPHPITNEPTPFEMKVATKTRGRSFLQTVKWSDIDRARDEYMIQIFPTSSLPSTPAGKLQAVGEMMDRGMLQGDQAIALLDFPDLEKVTSLVTAAIDDIDMLLEEMLENGHACTPEPFSNLQLAKSRMTSAYLRAKLDGVDEKNLEYVRRYIERADAMLNPPAPPAAPQAQGMAAPALPQGMAPPPAPVAGAPGSPMPAAPMAA